MPNDLQIICSCYYLDRDLSVHLVHGAITIIIIKCEKCQEHYTITPNTVQNA